jgi:hypothetical protein
MLTTTLQTRAGVLHVSDASFRGKSLRYLLRKRLGCSLAQSDRPMWTKREIPAPTRGTNPSSPAYSQFLESEHSGQDTLLQDNQ